MMDSNFTVVILKPTQTCVDWINSLPNEEDEPLLTLAEARFDSTAILIPNFEDELEAIDYLEEIHEDLFVHELSSWTDEPENWPEDLTFSLFMEWFNVEQHSVVYDCTETEEFFGDKLIDEDETKAADEVYIFSEEN